MWYRVNTPIDDSKNGTTCRESREESGKATTGTCVFLLSPNAITLSRGTLCLPNNGMLRVNLLELGAVGSNFLEWTFLYEVIEMKEGSHLNLVDC